MSDRPVVEVRLNTPIKHGSEEITVLRIRKPIAKDLRKMPGDPNTGDLLDLAAKLSNQPDSVIDKLEIEDMSAVLEIVGGFFPDSPATGA